VTGTTLDVATLSVLAGTWLFCTVTLVLTLAGRLPLQRRRTTMPDATRTTPVRSRLLAALLAMLTAALLVRVAQAWNWPRDVRLCLDLASVLPSLILVAAAMSETRRVRAQR